MSDEKFNNNQEILNECVCEKKSMSDSEINNNQISDKEKFFMNVSEQFKKYFPNKNNHLKNWSELNKLELSDININQLIAKIDLSPFLKERNYLGLEWCLLNYENIINGVYDSTQNSENEQQNFASNKPTTQKQANDIGTLERYRKANNFYSDNDLNSLFVTDYEALMKELEEEDARNREINI